jgi:hypothetical protein
MEGLGLSLGFAVHVTAIRLSAFEGMCWIAGFNHYVVVASGYIGIRQYSEGWVFDQAFWQ